LSEAGSFLNEDAMLSGLRPVIDECAVHGN
jgi:hypothetical protein